MERWNFHVIFAQAFATREMANLAPSTGSSYTFVYHSAGHLALLNAICDACFKRPYYTWQVLQ